jgi:hypothetical protein
MLIKTKMMFALLLGFIFIATSFSAVLARDPAAQTFDGDKLLVGESFTLAQGDTLNGNLVMLGGTLSTENGSTINGDLVIIGGTLSLAGKVTGNVISLGSTGNVADTAVVSGNLVSTGGWLNVSPQASITGTKNINTPEQKKFDFSQLWNRSSNTTATRNPLGTILWAVFRSLALAALAALVVLILPKPSLNMAETVRTSAAVSWLVGVLTLFVLPLVLVIMGITIILIPLIPLVLFVLAVGVIFGFIALGYEIGRKLEEMTHATWAPPIAAGIGVALLTLVIEGISILPCMGFIGGSIVVLMALGVVILARFGTTKYPLPPRTYTSSVISPGEQKNPQGNPPANP